MRIGYLHLGDPRHGVQRYGRYLAREAAKHPSLGVEEEALALTGPESRRELEAAAQRLSATDVVHLQYCKSLWGGGWAQLTALATFLGACSAPVVVTLHDVYWSDPWLVWKRRRTRQHLLRWAADRLPTRLATSALVRRARACLVCSEQDARTIARHVRGPAPRAIPHFVEERGELPERDDARSKLGFADERVVTLLGFVHPAKGHDLLVEALPYLPSDTVVVLAGAPSPGNKRFTLRLAERAAQLGVSRRLRITGYLSDEEQERVLVASDLAVAPFRFLSASGSLSTWISAARPILASALPAVEAYARIAPGAIATFSPYTPRALAFAVARSLERVGGDADPAVVRLRDALRLPAIFERHLALYEAVARGAALE